MSLYALLHFEEKESVAVTQNSANRKSSSITIKVLTVHVCSVYENVVKRILTGLQENLARLLLEKNGLEALVATFLLYVMYYENK